MEGETHPFVDIGVREGGVMNWRRVRGCLLGIAAVGVIAAAGTAIAGDEALEESMDEALGDLQPLLVSLINADYEAGLRNVEPVLRHASRLVELMPDAAKERRDQYLAYSYNLTKNAAILKSFLIVLAHEEKAGKGDTGSKTEHFPVVAATHFGGIVDMCVACHNSFRIKLEP
jgi:hypothetical protein